MYCMTKTILETRVQNDIFWQSLDHQTLTCPIPYHIKQTTTTTTGQQRSSQYVKVMVIA